ncbi:hypothetical protein [Sorangium sp. So ce363]|uniref:hypothetical protein n=1 Tax=Sorangium sp. So ce363 TaxID=3133304 RepID=UPI003F63FAE6
MSNKLWKLSCMLPALLMGVGCVAATDDQASNDLVDDEAVGSAEQAFSGYWGWWRETEGYDTPRADLAPDFDRTCFLSGVAGDLKSNSGSPANPPLSSAFAGVYDSGGRWYFYTQGNHVTTKVKATTLCVPSVANRTTPVEWKGGEAAKVLAPVTANRRCGLDIVKNSETHYNDNNWQAAGDSVMVWNDGTNWYIGGTGNAHGRGRCVDATSGSGTWGWTYIAPSSGTATHNLIQAIHDGTSPLGTQCFLTGVGGRFQTSSWTDGVFVTYDPGSTWWRVTVSNGKTAHIMCIQ